MKKMRNIYIVRAEDFCDEIQLRVDNKWYYIGETAWEVVKSRWLDKDCGGVRVLESGNDTLIVTINKKKTEKK